MNKRIRQGTRRVRWRETGVDISEGMLLVALDRSRLRGIFDITVRHHFVVFGTMDGKVLTDLTPRIVDDTASAFPVYFYETG